MFGLTKTVRICDVMFSDWISIEHAGRYTDTFIFHIDALNGLPPFRYRPLLQRLVAELNQKRPGASLWIRVDAPGEWYLAEIKRSLLRGFGIPYSVTRANEQPDYYSFSFRPRLYSPALNRPPAIDDGFSHVSLDALKCLQVLSRIRKGHADEIASLTGLSKEETLAVLDALKKNRLVKYKIGKKIQKDKSKPVELDPFPLWHPTRKGLSIALRSWGASRQVDFSKIKELNPGKICTPHRNISRRWLAWLRSAYPRAEIWTGWSETHLPGLFVYPDALAWGRIQGYETLFWLEVGDEHKSRNEIEEITKRRLKSAWKFCQRTGVRLVYAQLSVNWVQDAARWAFGTLPPQAAVVTGNRRMFGELPTVEWGKKTDL
jgi:hypothetical protein